MARIKISVMKKGDKVLFVNANMLAIQRKSGEVDLIPILFEQETNLPRLDVENITTIAYGDNSVECSNKPEGCEDEITAMTF